jgi:hydrogenase nickel incorporation protein HypA/HybF
MHEASLMNALMRRIEAIAAAEGAASVTVVRVRLGALAHMSPDHFREHWDVAARGGIAERAELEVEVSADLGDPAAQDLTLLSLDVEERSEVDPSGREPA